MGTLGQEVSFEGTGLSYLARVILRIQCFQDKTFSTKDDPLSRDDDGLGLASMGKKRIQPAEGGNVILNLVLMRVLQKIPFWQLLLQRGSAIPCRISTYHT